MRLLHLIPTFGPGGAERQLSLLAPTLSRAGIDTHVGYISQGVNFQAVDAEVLTHQLPKRAATDPRLLTDIVGLVRKTQPDIIQTWLTQMDVAGGLVAQALRITHILSERSSRMAYPASWRNNLRRRIGRRADMIIANSAGGVAYWQQYRPRGPVLHIANALAPLQSDPPPETWLAPASKFILFAGRFSYEKNLENLFEALEIVLAGYPDHFAVLFGEGPFEAELRRRIARSPHARRFRLPGFTSHLGYWLTKADVFVSVSHFEGHPNTVIESAQAGCPQVLSEIDAHRSILGEGAAKFVDGQSVRSIAEGIASILANPDEARARAAAAAEIVSALTIERQAEAYRQAYLAVRGGAENETN